MTCRRDVCSNLALAVILGLLCVVTALLAQSARTLALTGETEAYYGDWGGRFLPTWSGHALIGPVRGGEGPEAHLFVITKDGQREDVRFTFPGATLIYVSGASRRPDGALALVGAAFSSDSQTGKAASFVAWVSPDRTRQTVVRVAPYVPNKVAFAPDGTIWTAGGMSGWNYDVLWHFDESGRKLGSALPASTVRGGSDLGSHLTASRDRIGWYTGHGSGGVGEYFEFTPGGKLIDRFPGVPLSADAGWQTRAASLSENNDLVVRMANSGTDRGTGRIYALDRVTRSWVPLQFPDAKSHPDVAGFEGNSLVINPASDRIRFYKLPGPAAQH